MSSDDDTLPVRTPVARAQHLGSAWTARLQLPRAWIYASFPASSAGGNPAGVVVSDALLRGSLAQDIATVLSVPTTGFVVADRAAVDGLATVRFFTPQQEIPACGHASVAVAAALVEIGIWSSGRDVRLRAAGGDFPLRLRAGGVEMAQRLRVLEAAPIDWPTIEAALGPLRRHRELPLAVSGTGLRHLIVPVLDINVLNELSFDRDRISALADNAGVDTVCVWTRAKSSHLHVRDFCAAIGHLEEPASGTTSAALALYVARHVKGSSEFVIKQGIEMGRPSRIEVTVLSANRALVRGRARRVLAGALDLGKEQA